MAKPADSRFARFLTRALDLLAREAPRHFAETRRRMRGRAAYIRIDGDPTLEVQLEAEPWVRPAPHAEIIAATTQADLIAVLEGRLHLDDAIESNRIELRHELPHLLEFRDALQAWLHGAVRCASFPALYDEYVNTMGRGEA